MQKVPNQNIQRVQYTMERSNLRAGIEESEESQLTGQVNIFNKITEENFSNLKKEMPVNIQEAYRTPNRLDQERNYSCHIIIKTPNVQKKRKNIKSGKRKRPSNI
jgi:hypothetical protein